MFKTLVTTPPCRARCSALRGAPARRGTRFTMSCMSVQLPRVAAGQGVSGRTPGTMCALAAAAKRSPARRHGYFVSRTIADQDQRSSRSPGGATRRCRKRDPATPHNFASGAFVAVFYSQLLPVSCLPCAQVRNAGIRCRRALVPAGSRALSRVAYQARPRSGGAANPASMTFGAMSKSLSDLRADTPCTGAMHAKKCPPGSDLANGTLRLAGAEEGGRRQGWQAHGGLRISQQRAGGPHGPGRARPARPAAAEPRHAR